MAENFRSESDFIWRPTTLCPSLSPCLHTMKFKMFWAPRLPVVLIHIKSRLLCSSQNLLLNPVPSALHAWLITMVKLPTQPKSLSFWPFHSQEPSSAEESLGLEHGQDAPTWTHFAKGGAALGIHCCRHHSLPQCNAWGVWEYQNQKGRIWQLHIYLGLIDDAGTSILSKTMLPMQTNPAQASLQFKILSLQLGFIVPKAICHNLS